MFKLIVVCAFFAAAAAKPGFLYQAPITQYSTIVQPGTTTISKQDSSVIHPSPLGYYSTYAFPHLIKKRSPQWAPLGFVPAAIPTAYNTHLYPNVVAPLSPALPVVSPLPQAVHLIKKRSAPLLPTTYIAPTYTAAAPLLTTQYTATAPIISSTHLFPSTPLISQPIYSHLIKKRSAPLNTFIAPTAYSLQSRIDLHSTPLTSVSYTAPITYTSPITYSQVY